MRTENTQAEYETVPLAKAGEPAFTSENPPSYAGEGFIAPGVHE